MTRLGNINERRARAEAVRRWGPDAVVRRSHHTPASYFVGSGVQDERYGEGATWSDAFADADERGTPVVVRAVADGQEHEARDAERASQAVA